MAKQKENGPAETASSKSEVGVRDVIRTMKKNKKAIATLNAIGAKKPGIAEAIGAIEAEQGKLEALAMTIVKKQIADALADDAE